MNARLAVEENKTTERNLLNDSKELAERKGWTIEEAIDFKVSVYQKYAKSSTEAAAWEIRGKNAKKLI